MSEETWDAVDAYFAQSLLTDAKSLDAVLASNRKAGLPEIDVSPLQGKLLHLLVKITGARRVLEVGTLGGYSTICMATALPVGGRIVTLELDARHAAAARANFEATGVSDKVELIEGAAARSLETMIRDGVAPFDFVFIDADKASSPIYLDRAAQLSRSGTNIVLDNVVRDGEVVHQQSGDPNVAGIRRAIKMLGNDLRFDATAIQTVGAKGYDGFAICVVR